MCYKLDSSLDGAVLNMRFRSLLLPIVLSGFGQNALASNYYVGAAFGGTSQSGSISVADNSLDPVIPNVNIQKDYRLPDESVTGGSWYIGYRVSRDMAIEFGSVSMGEATAPLHEIDNGDPNVLYGGQEYSELSFNYLALVGVWPMGNNLSLTGKFGLAAWDFKFSQKADDVVVPGGYIDLQSATLTTDSYSDTGSDFYLGLGMSYGFNAHIDVRAEVTYLAIKPDFVNVDVEQDTTMFFLGVAYYF